ncbi:MAG: M3 family oligoendopeptidase, partial [Planctomycetota bacterium]
ETWLRDESELLSRISAETARRYVQMTCNTNDEDTKERYLSMEREVAPRVKVLADGLDGKFLSCPVTDQLNGSRYGVIVRQRRTASEIFREENTRLQAEEAELQTRQQALMGGLTVSFEGKEHTFQQMAPYYQKQDRDLRRRAFEATLKVRRGTWDELDGIYDELVRLRGRMARNAGFQSYTPFRFKELQRFDYGPELCEQFHRSVERVVVPAVARLNNTRQQKLGIESLRPYDLDVDLQGHGPFEPFHTEQELIQLVRNVFTEVDTRFADEFDILQDNQLLDLMSRKGKAPGGYQYTLEDIRLPFIFCNSVGTHADVQTMLHEGGHAFHAILSRDEPLLAYRDAPIEFAETASMSMELMGLEKLAEVYGEEEAARSKRKHLEGLLRIFPWIATIDAFQHWVYAHPDHDHEARKQEWLAIMDRFETGIDYTGYEDARAHRWTSQTHLFNHAFYYIEYGIAQIAALQIWQAYRSDPTAAVAAYRRGLCLGGSKPLPELFAAAGVEFDVSEDMLERLVEDIEQQMA